MKRTLTAFILSGSLLFESGGVGYVQDFDKGLEASKKGYYATAFRERKPLAEKAIGSAQHNRGSLLEDH